MKRSSPAVTVLAAVAIAALAGCAAPRHGAPAAAAPVPVSTKQPAALSSPECTYALSAVNTITSQGQINLTAGQMGAGVSAATARAWEQLLASAGKSITALPATKASLKLAFDVLAAQSDALVLYVDESPPQSPDISQAAATLVTDLQKVNKDCQA